MPRFIIEREIPGLGNLSQEELAEISQKSCDVANGLNEEYIWIESYVTDDKMYCVHVAPSEEVIRKHAKRGGFPANAVREVKSIFDATTKEHAPASTSAAGKSGGK